MKKVLDHGFVRLVDSMGSDLSIVRSARVSYNAAWRAGKDTGSDERLIKYLYANRHTTPFETVAFTFEVKAPVFVFRQWHRHRTWTYNEVSARYTQLPNEFYIPSVEDIGEQSKSNKQARAIGEVRVGHYVGRWLLIAFCKLAYALYKVLLMMGWPRELARMCLPMNVYTHMFATVDLHNLFHFLTLRTHAHAQFEIRQYAKAIIEVSSDVAPVAFSAWEKKD